MSKTKKDMFVYIGMLIIGLLIYFWLIPSQIHMNSSAKQEDFNPDTFPRFVTAVWFIVSAAGLLNSIRSISTKNHESNSSDTGTAEQNTKIKKKEKIAEFIPYFIFILLLIYGILFKLIGFIASTLIMPPIFLFVVGNRKPHYYAIIYGFIAVLYLLFKFVLNVPIR